MAQLQSAARVVAAIQYLTDHKESNLEAIAAHLQIHKSNALRLLATLRDLGWIEIDERHRYSLGPGLVAVGQTAAGDSSLQRIHTLGQELRDLSGETVHVAVPHGDRMLIVGRSDSPQALRVSCEIGSEDQLHSSSLGKAYLAALPQEELDTLLPRLDLEALTEFSITDLDALREQIDVTRSRGYSLDFEEGRIGVCCIGFAVRVGNDSVIAALSVTGPAHRWSSDAIMALAPELLSRVKEIDMAAAATR